MARQRRCLCGRLWLDGLGNASLFVNYHWPMGDFFAVHSNRLFVKSMAAGKSCIFKFDMAFDRQRMESGLDLHGCGKAWQSFGECFGYISRYVKRRTLSALGVTGSLVILGTLSLLLIIITDGFDLSYGIMLVQIIDV